MVRSRVVRRSRVERRNNVVRRSSVVRRRRLSLNVCRGRLRGHVVAPPITLAREEDRVLIRSLGDR
jgi:hypothetical protein